MGSPLMRREIKSSQDAINFVSTMSFEQINNSARDLFNTCIKINSASNCGESETDDNC